MAKLRQSQIPSGQGAVYNGMERVVIIIEQVSSNVDKDLAKRNVVSER